jgi:hypothetical protein
MVRLLSIVGTSIEMEQSLTPEITYLPSIPIAEKAVIEHPIRRADYPCMQTLDLAVIIEYIELFKTSINVQLTPFFLEEVP